MSLRAIARASLSACAEPLGWFERERFPALPSDEQAARAFTKEDLLFPVCAAPEVSIVIPVYGKFATTWSCLASLASTAAGRSFEVIVADDCSCDRTAEMLSHVRGIRVVRNPANLGYLRSNNRAAQFARGKWLCLLNNDTRVSAGWLGELVDTFRNFPKAGLVGAKLLFPDGRLQEAGGIVFRDGSCANYGRFRDPSRPEYSFARPVDYCSAACALLPKALWDQLAGFDEHFAPAYYEDTDLAFRVRQASLSVIYQPLARIVHYHGVTHGRDAKRGLKRSLLGNRQRFAERWQSVLGDHPSPAAPARAAAERWGGPGLLVLAEREPVLDDAGSLPRVWGFLEQALGAGHRVSLWSLRASAAAGPARLALQRRGVQVLHSQAETELTAFLLACGKTITNVVTWDRAVDHALLALVRRLAPRAQLSGGNSAFCPHPISL